MKATHVLITLGCYTLLSDESHKNWQSADYGTYNDVVEWMIIPRKRLGDARRGVSRAALRRKEFKVFRYLERHVDWNGRLHNSIKFEDEVMEDLDEKVYLYNY
jgi:hypothetical protein